MCPCTFISFNRCATLEWGVDSRGGMPGGGGRESVGNLSNFCCEPKTTPKKKKKAYVKKETKPAAENSLVLCLVTQS